MAETTQDNSEVSDAVSQSNTGVAGSAPAEALGTVYLNDAHSTALLFENAVAAQPRQNTQAMVATAQGVLQTYSMNTNAGTAATEKVAQNGFLEDLSSLLTILKSL